MNLRSFIAAAIYSGLLALAALAQGPQQTFTGTISDSMCGKKHMSKTETAAQCTRECVKGGMDYALVVGDKVYTLKGDKSKVDPFAGKPAVVGGTAKGETITVTSIAAPSK